MLARKLSHQLFEFLDHFPAIGIVGPRQVGKTTFVKTNIPKIKKESLYLDLESPADFNKLADPELFLRNYEKHTVIIDEIQRMPELFPVLRSLIDRNRIPGRFIILGSASPDLIRDSSESLAGRIVYMELNPFDMAELKDIKPIVSLWLRGGFPNAVLEEKADMASYWMQSFITTYIERDLPLLGFGAPVKTTERLWTMLAHVNGNLLNYTQIAGSLGISANSVKSYIQFFEKSFLIRTIPPFSPNTRKRLVKSPKLYFMDTGILHHMLRLFNYHELLGHPACGNSWEAFVIQQIINNLPIAFDANFYRTQDGSELDFILSKGGRIVAGIEIKHTNTPKLTRGNTLAMDTLNSKTNYVITPSSDDYPIRDNVQVCSIESFVFNVLPELVEK
jgi:predicted AAA+ superfamily ATPase